MDWSLVLFLLIACDGKKQKSLSVNDDNKSLTFTLPEVPIMLQSPEDRLNFMVQHYWDHFNFKDTAYIHVPDITEQALVDYMDLLNRVPSSLSDSCLIRIMQQASQEKKCLVILWKFSADTCLIRILPFGMRSFMSLSAVSCLLLR